MTSPGNEPAILESTRRGEKRTRARRPRLVPRDFYVFYIVRKNGGREEVFYTRKEADHAFLSSSNSTLQRVIKPKFAKHEETR